MREKYERILLRSHHVSNTRRRMDEVERAAQFAPYAALSGFESEVNEEARLTEKRRVLDESEIDRLNEKLKIVSGFGSDVLVKVTYFVNDERKSGGAYITKSGRINDIDEYTGSIIFTDKTSIKINSITEIEIL